jgi:hypothetical protein
MNLIRSTLAASLLLATGASCREGPAEASLPQGPDGWEFLGAAGEYVADIELSPWGLFIGTRGRGIGWRRADGTWEWLGPNYWHGHLYPQALLFVPGDPARLLAGVKFVGDTKDDTTAAAVFVSEDGGHTWFMSDGGLAEDADNQYRVYVEDLVSDPFDPDVLFMAGGELGILRSEDRGRTWNFVVGGYDLFGGLFGPLLVDPETPGRIWYSGYTASGYGRTGVSLDGGTSWDGGMPTCPGLGALPPVYDIETGLGPPGRVWLGWARGVMLAEAGGVASNTWVCEPAPGQPALRTSHPVVSLARFDGALYAATIITEVVSPGSTEVVTTSRMPALYRLREGASTWDSLPTPETAAGPTGAMIADTARGRLLIGTWKGLWAFTPP